MNRFVTRLAAEEEVTRAAVKFDLSDCDVLQWEQRVPHLPNCVGGDLFVYPGFVLYRASKQAFALLDFHDVKLEFRMRRFIERESIPPDTQVVGQAWAKSNRDGSPDRRFRDNYQIPVALYGEIVFSSASGLNEEYQFSNPALAQRFSTAWDQFQKSFPPTLGTSQPTAVQVSAGSAPGSCSVANTDVASPTALLLRLTSEAIAGLHIPPENKNAGDYLRAELLHLVLHFAALDGRVSPCEAQIYAGIAICIDPETHDTVENNVTFLKGLMNVWGKEELKRPHSLSLIEQCDRENHNNQAVEARAAFIQIASAVASADSPPNAVALAELVRFEQILAHS